MWLLVMAAMAAMAAAAQSLASTPGLPSSLSALSPLPSALCPLLASFWKKEMAGLQSGAAATVRLRLRSLWLLAALPAHPLFLPAPPR